MTKVFISHSSQDRDVVERDIIAPLNRNGIETWYSHDDIRTGARWEREIQRALSSSDWFLVVLSTNSARSEWVKDELNLAIRNTPDRIVPVMIEECDPASFHIRLPRIHYVDFRKDPQARSKLLTRFGVAPGETMVEVGDARDAVTASDSTGPGRFEEPQQRGTEPPISVPPFHFGGVVPPQYFTNRDDELGDAERIIRGRQSLLLVGEHRAGKTSFCKMLIQRMMRISSNDVLAAYMNVQQWPLVTIETFLEHTVLNMIGEIARQVFQCKYMALASPDPTADYPALRGDESFKAFVGLYRLVRSRTYLQDSATPAPFRSDEFVRFHEELSDVIRDKGWSNCVIFYDEANRLPRELSVDLLISHEEALSMAGITSVFAASPAMVDSFEPLQDSFGHQVSLGPFRETSDMKQLLARYCFDDPSRTTEIPLSDRALDLLWRLSQGKPFLIQLIAGHGFRLAAQRGDRRLDEEHVQEAYGTLREKKPKAFAEGP